MKEKDIIKGVGALKDMAENLCKLIEFCEEHNMFPVTPYIEEMQKDCSILTNILSEAFSDMITKKMRFEDDGK